MSAAESASSPGDPIALVPVGLRVDGREILVVGAGRIAARKAAAYADQGALLTVVAPEHSSDMDDVDVQVRHHRRFHPSDLDRMWLAVTATGIPAVDGEVFAAAEARQIWCNAADDPAHCSTILPAVVRRGPLTVSIATGGTSPAVASWLRRRLGDVLDDDTLAVAEIATRARQAVRDAGLSTEVPGWAEVLDNEALDLIADGRPEQLERRLFEAVIGDRPIGSAISSVPITAGARP